MVQSQPALCSHSPGRRAALAIMAAALTLAVCSCSAAGNGAAAPAPDASGTSAKPAEAVARGPRASRAPVWISQLQMTSVSTGWALLWTGNPDANAPMQLGRTTDGGRTWRVVTPTAAPPLATADLVLSAVSTGRAWLAVATSKSADGGAAGTTVVYGTGDGGRIWRRSQPLPGSEPIALDFVGRSRGWLLESLGEAMSQNPVKLYGTSDGGVHWSPLAKSQGVPGSPRVGRLTAVCDKTGLRFQSARLGWITADCPAGPGDVLATSDGGARWTPVSLPAVAAACQQGGCEVPAPEIAGSSALMVVGAYPANANLLVSTDHGLTWQADPMPGGAGPYPRVTFFTARDGIAVSAWSQGRIGRDFFITTNGGLSWRVVRQGRRFGGNWNDFDFVSQQTGFAWTYPGAGPSAAPLRLYRTSDSGRIWASFVPRLS
jgi:photosystem II stability/assembly factor-like uncharacterized protein